MMTWQVETEHEVHGAVALPDGVELKRIDTETLTRGHELDKAICPASGRPKPKLTINNLYRSGAPLTKHAELLIKILQKVECYQLSKPQLMNTTQSP